MPNDQTRLQGHLLPAAIAAVVVIVGLSVSSLVTNELGDLGVIASPQAQAIGQALGVLTVALGYVAYRLAWARRTPQTGS
jgi:hypothetical protein